MIIGSKFIFYRNIESTNSIASGLVKSESVSEGTVIYTNYQSAGRGQKGNRWESEDDKNLLCSIVLFPSMVSPEDQFIISMSVSLGICDFLKTFIPLSKIKWPNDIYAGDDKIAGILIENSITGNLINSSIAGIGLNINQDNFPADIPNPVSLKILTGREYDTGQCLNHLAGSLDERYKQLISARRREIRDEYVSSLYRLGEWHDFNSRNGIFSGRIISVNGSGSLMIEDRAAKIREFSFKEIDFIIYPSDRHP
jgi:BirA family transcriptional regulator, biotin operon repressor / biotin---[acetyl-CoA-carboxylase] ligase